MILVVVLAAFPLVVQVVAKPLLRLLRREPPKPPPGPPKPAKTKRKTKQNEKHRLASPLKETESTWSLVDADSNGVVSMKELQAKLWTDHGPYATMMQVQRFRAADANKDGLLQYNEFHEFLHVVDAPGLLYHEFRRLEKAAGMEVADEEAAEEEFHLHDSNGDGLLSHQEFEKLMAGHQLFKPRAKPRRLIASVDSRGERAFTMDHMPKALQKLLSSTSSEEFFAHPAAHGRFGGEL